MATKESKKIVQKTNLTRAICVHKKVLTAEGWRRMMLKKTEKPKKAKK